MSKLRAHAPHGRLRVIGAAAAVAAAGVVLGGYLLLHAGAATTPGSAPGGAVPLGTATIRRMDLTATQRLEGTLGYASPGTVVSQVPAAAAGETPAQAQAAVESSQRQLGAARSALDDLRRVDAVTIAQAQAGVARAQAQRTTDTQTLDADEAKASADTTTQQRDCTASPPAAACGADEQAVSHDNQAVAADQQVVGHDTDSLVAAQDANSLAGPHAQQAEDAQAAQVSAAQSALVSAEQQLAAGAGTTTVVTALPTVGQTIDRGQPLFSLGGRPVPLLVGASPAYRALEPGIPDGPDIAELQDNLNHLGAAHGLAVDGRWSDALTAAVKTWQASLGVPDTGALSLGQVEILPSAIRVTSLHLTPGAVAPAGTPILDDTSTARQVTAQLPAAQTGLAHAGDPVSVALPDGRTTASGHISSVAAADALAAGGQAPGQQAQQQNGAPQAWVAVTITLDDPSAVAGFDVAPVSVEVTAASAHGVLAVPVDALLALEGGGDAVEVVRSGGAHDIVPVTPGLFDGSAMVEVRGGGIAEGMTVVVPAP